MRFKRGDRVYVVDNTNSDTKAGVTGVFKRIAKDQIGSGLCIIKRDDGHGWSDGKSIGWNVKIKSLALLSERFEYEIDA